MGYTKFVKTWNEFLPFIKIMQPSTDLCYTCQKNTEKISGCAGALEEDKIEAVEAHQNHLRKAKCEREIYNSAVDAGKHFLKGHPNITLLSPSHPCSLQGTVHYSYDYAQQVHYPRNPQQLGPIYFKTARECGIFGICCEAIPHQINYFIDESFATGKGANATISYVHDFLENHGAGETDVHFHVDNCGGQNKNNYVLWYWCWHCIHGQHENITYSFLVAAHTKFSPDWCFGLMRQRIRRTFVSALFDILEANHKSTLSGVNCGKPVGLHDGTVLVKTYDWSGHLAPKVNRNQQISPLSLQQKLSREGVLQGTCRHNRERISNVERRKYTPSRLLPPQVLPSGLDDERTRYLHKEIREFCRPNTEDFVAPVVP